MDLKQLKTFIYLAEAGSLSRASDRLRIAQPALSRHIKLLESEIGVTLFARHARGMDLTEEGKQLLSRVSGLIRQLEQSVYDIRSIHTEVSGNVALGLMPTVTTVLAVRLVERVARDLPQVSLRLVEGYSVHLIEWLQRGDIDLTFLYGPSGDFHLRTQELLHEDVILISPSGSLPDTGPEISIEEVAGLELVLPSRPYGVRLAVDAISKRTGVAIEPTYDVDSFWVIKSLVKSGVCHSFMPLSSVTADLAAGLLEVRKTAPAPATRQLILGMPSDRSNTRATDAVIGILKDEIALMIREGEWVATPDTDLHELMNGAA